MHLNLIKKKLRSFYGFNGFSEMEQLLSRATDRDGTSWDYVFYASEACGGTALQAIDAAAANFCMLTAIHLVDDMLDNDPKGDYHKYGSGTSANMALAYQALAINIINSSSAADAVKLAVSQSLCQMMMHTSVAQQYDVNTINEDEAGYWKKVADKTPPLFSSALFSGALYGGGTLQQAIEISELGLHVGKLIQVSDDLSDIYKDVVEPDWKTPENNLALLYCLEADYELKPDFLQLVSRVNNTETLKQAQQIVTASGGLSYCIYHILALYQELMAKIQKLEIPCREKLEAMAGTLIHPSMELIKLTGISNPEQFLEMELKTFD